MKKCRVTGELVEEDDCCGVCSVCDNAMEDHIVPIKRKDRSCHDGNEEGKLNGGR